MANYIITNNRKFFDAIGKYNFCTLEEMQLTKHIAVDSETTSLNPREGDMFAIQIGTGKNNYLIDMQTHNNGIKFEEVIPYLEGRTLIGQNFTFDLTFMYAHGFYPEKVMDTFIASKILYNGYPGSFRHGFAYIMERELGIDYDKSEQKNIHVTQLKTKKSIQYCFNDVDRLVELMLHLWNKIKNGGFELTAKLHFEYIKGLAYMENCGVPLDTTMWQSKMKFDIEQLVIKEKKVIEYIYENAPKFQDNQVDMFDTSIKILPKLSSNKQMIPVFKYFDINVITDEGKESIGEDQINKSDHEFVGIWLDYKHAQHSVSNFGQTILDKVVDGRIYTSFNPILDTARISTRKGGINFLNFPANKETRECIRAKDGYKMIVSDYDGQENSVGADLHQDPMMLKSLFDGLDLHCAFAKLLFPDELAELDDAEIISKHKDKRDYSKAPRFLFAYGGSAYTLHVQKNIPLKEAYRIENLFQKDLHPGVYEWGDKVLKAAIKVGYIESAGGFKLHLPYFDDFKKNQAKVESLSREFWQDYKKGKNKYKERFDEEGNVDMEDELTYQEKLYLEWKSVVSNAAKTRSKYMRLCLNNPIQTTSDHQTKLAVVYLFNHIKKNGHLGLAKICNVPHDEIVLEVVDHLVDEYQEVLGDCMRRAGDYFLTSGLLKMGAEANVGLDWYEAK